MRTIGIRYGTATNSSSTHSVLLRKPGLEVIDVPTPDESLCSFYCCATKTAKTELLLRHLAGQMSEWVGGDGEKLHRLDEIKFLRAKAVVDPGNLVTMETILAWDGGPDHEVLMHFPMEYGSEDINLEFLKDFTADILQEDVFVAGARDDSDAMERVRAYKDYSRKDHYIDSFSKQWLSERWTTAVKTGPSVYTIMDRETGNKVRVQMGTGKLFTGRTLMPELVDISITNYCNHSCPYCYRGCDYKGKHAETPDVNAILWALKEAKVLEIAIGGGEPLEHPHFWRIAETARNLGMHVNVSTRDCAILYDPETLMKAKKFLHGVGMTVTDAYRLGIMTTGLDYADVAHTNRNFRTEFVLHIPMGVVKEEEFKKILARADEGHYSLLLLGFKHTGRGETYRADNYMRWLPRVLSRKLRESSAHKGKKYWSSASKISFDTSLVKQMEAWLKKNDIDPLTFQKEEGQNSCFIDAVDMTMSKSSFHPDKIPFVAKTFREDWLKL